MELPIAPQTYHDSPQTLIRAIRQADELLTGTSTQARDIEGARLYINPKLPGVHMANYAAQLYTPAGETPGIVLQRVMREFEQAGQRCYWLQLAELDWQDDWIQAARTLGYQPGPRVAVMRMQLRQPAPHPCSFTDDPTWQVLPGRVLWHSIASTLLSTSRTT
ncbi:MAG: hypothetical protein HC898_09630 [Phycisphaerales bacterium]|nr:hypothetical protein [Phycisphaerales bacterium]